MDRIRCGVIGYGNIGRRHVEEILDNTNLELVAVCDPKPEVEGWVNALPKARNHIEYYKNYKYMLNDYTLGLDLVSICTPNYLHWTMSVDALETRINVLCEKPMALTKEHCEVMIHTAMKYNKKLFIVKQNRYNAPIVEIMKNRQYLGNLYFATANCFWNRNMDYYKSSKWKGRKELEGGALYTQFSHFVDALLYLKGSKPDAIFGSIVNLKHGYLSIDDSGVVIMKFNDKSTIVLNFTNNAYNKNMESSITLFFDHGTLKIGGQYLNILEYNESDVNIEIPNSVIKPNVYGTKYIGSAANHKQVYQDVTSVLNNDMSVPVTGIEGMRSIEVIEAAYKSSKYNKPVEL